MACRRSPVRARLAPLARPPPGGLFAFVARGTLPDAPKPSPIAGVRAADMRDRRTNVRRLSKLIVGAAGAAALMTGTAHGQGAVQVSQSGWQWGNPTPQGNTIRAIDFKDRKSTRLNSSHANISYAV